MTRPIKRVERDIDYAKRDAAAVGGEPETEERMSNDEKILDALKAIRRELAAIRAANAPKVSVEQAALLLGCGRTKVFEYLAAGALTKANSAGRGSMVTMESVQRLQRDGAPAPRKPRAAKPAPANEPSDDDLSKLVAK